MASFDKWYALNDKLYVPLGVTVDFDLVRDGSITLLMNWAC